MLKSFLSPAFIKKALKILALLTAVIAVMGFLVLPAVLRPVLERKIAETIHRRVSIRSIYFNPFTLAAALKGVTISQRDSSEVMLSFDEFYVNVQAASVAKGGLIVSRVRLVRPYLNITRNKDLTYNFSDLAAAAPEEPKEKKEKKPFKFSINNIEVKDGSADFTDAPRNTRHAVRDVYIAVPFLSNFPYYLSSYVEPSLRATVNGTVIALKGKTMPFNESLETAVDIDLKDIDLPHYLAYSPVPLNFKLLSGSMDVRATLSFQQFKNRPPAVSIRGVVALKDIRLADMHKKPLVELPLFQVSFLPSDLLEKAVHFSDISLRAPKIYVERDQRGELDILKAFAPEKSAATDKQGAAPPKAGPADEAPLPLVDIDALSVQDGMVRFTDWQPVAAPPGAEETAEETGREPARLLVDRIALKGGSLSTRKDSKGTLELSLNINRKGLLRIAGAMGLNPLDLEASVNIGDMALTPFQPYLAQKADVLLTDGRFSTKGTARIRAGAAQGVSASYRGSASLSRLAARDSRNNEELLSWKLLRFDRIDAEINPLSLKIKTISLSDFFASIVTEEDGGLNLQKILKKEPVSNERPAEEKKEEAPSAGSGPPPDIAIGQVLIASGRVNFIDRHVKPMYTANLLDIHGKVSGLSSKEDLMAEVLLQGSFDQYAPLVIEGKINPLRNDLFVDLKADFKDMELSPLTPYSGTYIGKAIEKGKLSFDLQYHIVQKKLDAKNGIFIDQLTLGGKIDSPEATKLPVGLAISLLKNRKGEIRLDIPVSGKTDDPEFSVWRIVLKVLVNLLTKAATSPFSLLGMLGGGEDLGYVEFDYGAFGVTEQNAKKIEALANSLYERPELKLEITGHADPANDGEALRALRMKNLIAAQKLKDLPRTDDQTVSPESVQVSAAEYPVYLKKAYKSGKFPKPRNMFGIAKDLPDAEMEKLLLASIRITDDDLRQLASTRARTVRELILNSHKVEPERIFLLEPKALLPEEKDKLRNSRVDFSLK
ncbi:MAG TPA: DUF748 domain-containing protein [Nitrospirota bacterium]